MNTCKSPEEYISAIAPSVQRCCKRYGYLSSVLIAQSLIENGAGIPSWWDNPQIALLMEFNNMVGIKSDLLSESWADKTVWTGESLTKKTPEYYDGKKVIITDNFRKYDNIEQSFADFLLFMKYGAYQKGGKPKYGDAILSIKDPETLITKVNKLGYATSSQYAAHVMKVIRQYGLTKYDDLTGVEPTIYTEGYRKVSPMKKTKKLEDRPIIDITARNKSQIPASRGGNKIEFIVCHYLGVPNADNPDLYGGGYGGHYNIERNGKVYKAANPKTAVVWHCGGGLQGSGGHEFFKICTNYNSIGIECGVCYTDKNAKEGDGDSNKWYFTEETQESLVWLVSKLMDEYNVPFEHVIRHYSVTGKICPNPYVKNNGKNGNWTWDQFKSNLKQYRKDGTITLYNGAAPTPEPVVEKWYRIRKSWSDAASQIGAYKSLDNAKENCPKGYAVYDWNGKEIYRPAVTFADKFLAACKSVADTARIEKWTYGDSHATPPCADHVISCDRLPSRANYDLGYTDQRQGGETCGTLPDWLPKHGWTKITDKKKIVSGAIVAVRKKDQNFINHVFVVKSYNVNTDMCDKYDTGSNERIKTVQPFKSVPLVEWPDRTFVCAWNPPSDKPAPDPKPTPSDDRTWKGVNYAPVYNYTYYRKKYPDLQKAFGTDKKKYFEHFCNYGMKECRQACAAFNVKKYKERYADLRKAFGDRMPEYYKHYCVYGKKEGRNGK